jgi:Holliday junction resolvase RusA-like endonuclease
VIKGLPATKKTGQRVVRSKRGKVHVLPSERSKSWEDMAIVEMIRQHPQRPHAIKKGSKEGRRLRWFAFPKAPVHVKALFYRDANRGDLTGFKQAVGDALERSGTIVNDSLIESWDGSRKLIDRKNPRVEIELTPMDAP